MTRLDHITITVSKYVASRDWYASNFSLRVEFEDLKAGFGGLEDDGNTELIFLANAAAPPTASAGSVRRSDR